MGCTSNKSTVIESKEIVPVPTRIHIDTELYKKLKERRETKKRNIKEMQAKREDRDKMMMEVLYRKSYEAPRLHIENNKLYRNRSENVHK